MNIEQALQQGMAAHKAGKLQEAERYYRTILQAHPVHPVANHNLGVIAVSLNKAGVALPLFKTAIEVNPKIEQFWLSYIDALIREKQFETAKQVLVDGNKAGLAREKVDTLRQQLMSVSSDASPPESELDSLLEYYQKGRYGDAEKLAVLITQQFPEHQFAWKVLGAVLKQTGMVSDSLIPSQKSVKLAPQDAEANNNLGVTLRELGRLEEAEASYKKAIALKSDDAVFHYNLGLTLKELCRLEEAEASYKKAIALKPDYDDAYNNMGIALKEKGDIDGAIDSHVRVFTISPDNRNAWINIFFPLKVIQSQNISLEDQLPFLKENNLPKSVKILASLLTYKLNLGSSTAETAQSNAINHLSMAENISIENPDKNTRRLERKPHLLKKVVALTHFGRCGTGLLHSLIDGHSQVSTLPSIYFSEFFDDTTWKKIIRGSWDEMPDHFISMYPVFFDAFSSYPVATKGNKLIHNVGQKEGMTLVGEGKDEALMVDKVLFREELHRLMTHYDQLDALAFFQLVHSAYEKALNHSDEKRIIFYHIHNPDVYAKLNFIRSAPQANWVMMVREPVQSCESWIRQPFYKNDYEGIVNRVVIMLFQIDDVLFRTQRSIGVRLEDLKEKPKETMLALCDYLGIDEEESLYEMTAQGKKWWGDLSSTDLKEDHLKPFGKASIERKVGLVFSDNDQFVMRTLFYPFSVRFGYVEEDTAKFKNDLLKVRTMIDQMFDFERIIIQNTKVDEKQFMKSGSYRYLRRCLIDRWNILNEFHTYPHILEALSIDTVVNYD